MVSSNVFPAFAITAEEIPRFFAISAELTEKLFDTSLTASMTCLVFSNVLLVSSDSKLNAFLFYLTHYFIVK